MRAIDNEPPADDGSLLDWLVEPEVECQGEIEEARAVVLGRPMH